MAWTQAQVVNSNSTSSGKETHQWPPKRTYVLRKIETNLLSSQTTPTDPVKKVEECTNLDACFLVYSMKKPCPPAALYSHWESLGSLVSTYVVCDRLSMMHKQVSGWTVNFCPNSPESPFLEFQTRKLPPPMKNFRFEMTKVYSRIPPQNEKLQIWDDQSLLRNTPPKWKTSDLRWPKFTPEYPPKWKTSDLTWQKFTPECPPPPKKKTSDLRWPKFTPEYPPKWKTSDLRWPKFTLEYHPPPPLPPKNFRFEMTKVYSGIPPSPSPFESLESPVDTTRSLLLLRFIHT